MLRPLRTLLPLAAPEEIPRIQITHDRNVIEIPAGDETYGAADLTADGLGS